MGAHVRLLLSSLAAALILLAAAPDANAQIQVSDQFTHVAKEVAKRFLKTELVKACDRNTATGATVRDPICATMVASVSDLFSMAIDQDLDANHVALALRDEFTKLVEATATEIVRAEGERLLTSAVARGGPLPACSPAGLAGPLAACFVARAYKGNVGAVDDCTDARRALGETWIACGGKAAELPKTDVPSLVRTVRDRMTEALGYDKSIYLAATLLTQIADVAERGGGTFYALSRTIADEQEKYLAAAIARPTNQVFGADADVVLNAIGACAQRGTIEARVRRWQGKRAAVFLSVARSVSRMRQPLAADLNEIPDDLPPPQCPSADVPFAKAVTDLVRDAHTYRVDVEYAARLQQVLLPGMLVAILADYVRTQDDAMFMQNVRDFALQVFARVIAATDGNDLDCTRSDGKLSCVPLGAKDPTTIVQPPDKASLNTLEHVIQDRRTPTAARTTCAYQAVSALVAGSFSTIQGMPSVCRLDFTELLKDTALFAYLEPVANAPGFARWKADRFLPSVVPGAASLRLEDTSAKSGFELLHSLLTSLAKTGGLDADVVLALEDSAQSLDLGLTEEARRELLRHASDALRPELSLLLDTRLEYVSVCQQPGAPGLPCAVRVLLEAAYDPVMTYVSAPSASQLETSRVVSQLYQQLDELDPLGATPILFNVGLGATALTRDGTTGHLTLLDKFGLATRFGDRHEWELGVFVGGFIDAIIRESVGAKDAEPFWLAGATFGRRQFSKGLPLGFELHAAAGLPFDLSQTGDRIAFAWGGALIVPADIAFGGNK